MRMKDAAPVALGTGIATTLEPVDWTYFDAVSRFEDREIVQTIMERDNRERADARATG